MANCVFCQVIAGEIPSSVVASDEWALAFMDLRQTNEGHVLVVPKQHVETLDALPAELAAPLLRTTSVIVGAVRRTFNPHGISVWQSNGEAAGQEVPHVHFHVFPRFSDDGHLRVYPGRAPKTARAKLDALAARIAANLRPFAAS